MIWQVGDAYVEVWEVDTQYVIVDDLQPANFNQYDCKNMILNAMKQARSTSTTST